MKQRGRMNKLLACKEGLAHANMKNATKETMNLGECQVEQIVLPMTQLLIFFLMMK